VHGASVNAMAFRVKDAAHVYKRALELGAEGVEAKLGPMELNIPPSAASAARLYLVDRYGDNGSIYDVDFQFFPGVERNPKGVA
jgi:4-hydroxyphenylpyruvate dioxygenase